MKFSKFHVFRSNLTVFECFYIREHFAFWHIDKSTETLYHASASVEAIGKYWYQHGISFLSLTAVSAVKGGLLLPALETGPVSHLVRIAYLVL